MTDHQQAHTVCQTHVRQTNPVLHFQALTVPEAYRQSLFSLYAFQCELDRIPQLVNDPSMGEIRLTWWRDLVSSQSKPTGDAGPIAQALQGTIQHYNLPRNFLVQMIEARLFDLYNDPMPDNDAFDTYAGEVFGLPSILAAQILSDGQTPHYASIAGNLAIAQTINHHVAKWQQTCNQQKLFLPLSTFTETGLDTKEIFSPQATGSKEVQVSLLALLQRAKEKQEQATQALQAEMKGEGAKQSLLAFSALAYQKSWTSSLTKAVKAGRLNSLKPLPAWRAYWKIWRYTAKL